MAGKERNSVYVGGRSREVGRGELKESGKRRERRRKRRVASDVEEEDPR